MNINLTPFAILWALLAAVVLALIGYRKVVSTKDDETIHVLNAAVPAQQAQIAHKLDQIDKWGKLLTIIAVIYGLVLFVGYTYQTFMQSSGLGG